METEVVTVRLPADRMARLREVREAMGLTQRQLFEMMVDALEVESRPALAVDPRASQLEAYADLGRWAYLNGSWCELDARQGAIICRLCREDFERHAEGCVVIEVEKWRAKEQGA